MSLRNLSVGTRIPKILNEKLKNKRINQIYREFENSLDINEDFLVAVSGGPDSLALAFLAKIYSIKKKIKSKFVIIDHRLRPESTKEAKEVKNILKKYLISAEVSTWRGRKPIKNIQSIARKKRYEILFAKCDKYKIKNILLGHHEEDLLENFFIRIFRGSGLNGLISLENINKIENKNLLRPLLYLKKNELLFISKHVFGFYVKDPSNKNEKFLRIKIRKLIQKLQNNGLEKKKFLKTIKNLKSSNKVINFYVNQNLQKNSFFRNKNNRLILNQNFFQQPYEVTFRSLSESLKIIGKKYYSVRGKKLEKIIKDLENNHSIRATLGGCIIEKVNQTVIISKEI